jgi:hypothetical protein
MDIQGVVNWIFKNPRRYPGSHLEPQPRTQSSYKPIEPASQMQLIWKATIEFIHEKLLQGKGVNIRGFGAFTFDVETELPQPANMNPLQGDINQQRLQRKHLHKNRPVFVPDPQLRYLIRRYHGKEQLDKPSSQHSVYQKGFQMIFCNPVPLAQACFLDKQVVSDAHSALWSAVRDLTKLGHTINLPFNFCAVVIKNLALEVHFTQAFLSAINDLGFEKQMRKSDFAVSQHWRSTSQGKWESSALSSLWKRPDSREVQSLNDKTYALRIMSLDLSSTSPRPVTSITK